MEEKKTSRTRQIKSYLTKIFNKDNTVPYAWINTEYYTLDKTEIEELKEYIEKKRFYKIYAYSK